MSDDSSDSSELDTRPSSSRNRYQTRNVSDQKRKHGRILMRIEFGDSDESSSSSSVSENNTDDDVKNVRKSKRSTRLQGEGGGPSSSVGLRSRQSQRNNKSNDFSVVQDEEDSDEFQRNAALRRQRRGGRRVNPLDVGISDGSTSGSEITDRKKSRGKVMKKYIVSEDEREPKSPHNNAAQKQAEDRGFTSDSSSNELLEKCPICLLSFRQQEIGSPSSCQHIFCANCIEAWSKNVQTCPIDRLEFQRIIVRESYENRKIVREINVDPNAAKELILDDDDEPGEDVTNCEVCNSPDREDVMLLCDECNQGYHMDCLQPPLSEIPEGSWFCDNCVGSEDDEEDEDDQEDLNMLYEDIRDMGIPETRLRVREIQQPRILRTRQNERIRAAILRHTAANMARLQARTTTTTTSSAQRGRPRTTTTTTTTTTTRRTTSRKSASGTARKPTRKRRRRRRARQRTYVVEYDVNNFDEKFAIKATKKVIRRRRRKVRSAKKAKKYSENGVRMTASKRLAEQLGVKPDPRFTSHLSGSSAGLSLTGGANDLEYFSDSDAGGNIESEIHIETGSGTAVQTSVRISNYGSQRSRKGLLLGRIKPNHVPQPVANRDNANTDILSSIMDMQDRWHSASRNLESVHINTDGTLNLPGSRERNNSQAHTPTAPVDSNLQPRNSTDKEATQEINPTSSQSVSNGPNQNEITQAPMYSRGGGNSNFNNSGGGGGYNNRYGNNQGNYRGGGGNQYRASTGSAGGGSGGGMNFNMSGRSNYNFGNSSNYNNQDQPSGNTFTPFRQWNYNNQRNQQNEQNNQNSNHRNSLPFTSNNQQNDNSRPPPQQQQPQNPFSGIAPQQCFPPPQGSTRQNQGSSDDLFGGLPPPVTRHVNAPVLLSVPPPPTPPAMMVPPAAAIFNMSSDYGRDDDSNCPNFAIYSQESQEVAKSSEAYPERNASSSHANEAKEDDENEDLVQLDDDEEGPPPQIDPSDLYEPENPTEEMDDDDSAANEVETNEEECVDNEGDNGEKQNDKVHGNVNDNNKVVQHDDDDAIEEGDKDKELHEKEGETDNDEEAKLEQSVENKKITGKKSTEAETAGGDVSDDEADNNNSDKSPHTATKDDGDDFDDDEDSDDNEDVTGKRPKKGQSAEKDPARGKNGDAASLSSSRDDTSRGHTPTVPYNGRRSTRDTVRSPSQDNSDVCVVRGEAAAATSAKGSGNVIELYDDSDWDELNTDKGTSSKRRGRAASKDVCASDEPEPDRSYTPCLDENNDPEIIETRPESPIVVEAVSLTPDKNANNSTSDKQQQQEKSKEAAVETDIELIISEEELDNSRKKRGGNLLDPLDDGKNAKFKKVKKRKKRNYRGEKPPQMHMRNRFIRRTPSSRSRSRSRRRSRSRSRMRSISRSRSRSYNSFRSRSRSPRQRRRGRSNSRSSFRDKGRYGGRVRGRSWDGGRIPRAKPKRRELPRYDVRNVVGNKPVRDRYGRDTSRSRRSRSRSISRRRSPISRTPFSRSRSPRIRSRSRRRSLSRSRSISRSRSRSRSLTKSRSKSLSRSRTPSRPRNRRPSISLSPSPQFNRRRSFSPPPRRFSPVRRRSISPRGRRSLPRRRSRTPLRVLRSRSISIGAEQRLNGHKVQQHHFRNVSHPRIPSRDRIRSKSRSLSISPRYTPQVSRLRSKSPLLKAKKKKAKEVRKKKSKRRLPSLSPSPNRRIARQADPFSGIEKPAKKKRRHLAKAKSPIEDHGWSPSPSPAPPVIASNVDYQQDKNVSWTPPMHSPALSDYAALARRSVTPSRKDKTKRKKKNKKSTKRRVIRKEKKRRRRTETPEPIPSKEVFASGNNILVSVSFNKENTTNQPHGQQTIVTLPPNREDLLPNRRVSIDHTNKRNTSSKKQKEKRKKVESKPVAIIDLERSPFQVEQEQTDVIVLTDSEETRERDQSEHRRERRRSESRSRNDEMDNHRGQRQEADSSQRDKSPERLDTIHEESYDLPQTGPKTPPEPPGVKFNLQSKKANKVRNPLHDDDDYDMPSNSEQQQAQESHHSDLDGMHGQGNQKIGPNTPPESGPCSPDAYDPFEPTKSPSISPRSPTPPPSQLDVSQNTICESSADVGSTQKHHDSERRDQMSGIVGNLAQGASINPIDLVMALMTSKSMSSNHQESANKSSNDSQQYTHNLGAHEDSFRNKNDEKAVTVISNVLLNTGNGISSPTPPTHSKKVLPLPKVTGSVGGSSSSGVNMRNGGTSNNADDAYTINDADSPYSPGSGDYEDLFEPPPDATGSKRYSKRGAQNAGKTEIYDNLFGSTSPVLRLPSYTPSKKTAAAGATTRASKTKAGRSEHPKLFDDLPNNTTLDIKERFIRKLNRQERVVEEVKLVLKPRFNKKQITKEDYKEIMRRAVPKICHSRSGEIDPHKIKNLIDAYVKKFRAKHKKLSLVSTGQVSSAVKCAAYLKKL